MKSVTAMVLVSFAATGFAQSGHDPHHAMQAPAKKADAAEQTHRANGVVKSVNRDKGTITIAHEAVESLNWPGMTMGFKPRDKQMLDSVKPGQKVDFEFVKRGKDYVLVQLR